MTFLEHGPEEDLGPVDREAGFERFAEKRYRDAIGPWRANLPLVDLP